MRVFEFEDLRVYLNEKIKSLPRGGRGALLALSKAIRIHTSTLSQILAGDRRLSMEHAVLVAEYFGLNERETEYFLLLVQLERAGSEKLKGVLERQLRVLREEAQELTNVLPSQGALSLGDSAVFHSNWFYAAIRVLSSVPGYQTPERIAERWSLPLKLVNEVVEFLVTRGLCVEKAGQIHPGPQYTHLEASSPLVSRHHSNWRVKAMEKHPALGPRDLAYSSPLSISVRDAERVRELLVQAVAQVNALMLPSDCEKVYCFNVDWIEL